MRRGLVVAAAALAFPAVVHALIRHRLRAPDSPRWGRTHRYAGHLGPVVFQQLGTGSPPVVLLHALGPGFDSEQWRGAAEALASRFRVYVPDLPGWGRSAAPPPRPATYLAILADFLTGVLRERAVLVGAGLAASYAVQLAADQPDRVRALALVGPSRPAAASPADLSHLLTIAPLLGVPLLRVSVLDALTSRAALAHYLRRRAYAAPERVDAALLEHHYRVSHLPAHREALAAFWRGELDPAPGEALSRLRVPVCIVRGAGQAGAGSESSNGRLSDLPTGSTMEVLPGSRELPHAEQPLAFCAALGRFIESLETDPHCPVRPA
jgi:pimeloyl-ACP methyl ester carboxylesterase